MGKIFKVKVNDSFDFEISQGDLAHFDAIRVSNSKFHVLQENKSYKAEITDANFYNKQYQVKVNNNTYSIDISNDLDVLIKDLGFEIGNSKKVDKITAPMPGLILEITVNVGDEVKENDSLLILEAMKMENVISSPREGVIKSITAKTGDAVDKNALLIEFE